MRISNILIAIIWAYFILDALRQGVSIPKSPIFNKVTFEGFAPIILVVPFAFFLSAAFLQRRTILKSDWLYSKIDRRYGQGSAAEFIARLRPITLFMVAVSTLGISGLVTTFFTTKANSAYVLSGFFVSGGLGLFCAYLLSIKYPPRLN